MTPHTPLLYRPNCEWKPGMEIPAGWQRYALVVEYNGSNYQGFQKQQSASHTLQQRLEQALSAVAEHPVTLVCAGRTDAGVHATAQVVHFDTTAQRPEKAWRLGVNSHLPSSIRVRAAKAMPWHFHARFSALARTYRYLIYSSRTSPALLQDQVGWTRYPLNLSSMQAAAEYLIGEHDFTSFRAKNCQAKCPIRDIQHLSLTPFGQMIVLEIKANAFLQHMVRNIVGSLIDIGRGHKPVAWIQTVLAAKDRAQAAATAPSSGLYFVAVDYPPEFTFQPLAKGPYFLAD